MIARWRRRRAAEERLRRAQELHDAVAQQLATISIHCGLAEQVFDTDPQTARDAVTTIGVTSRAALAEMRHLTHLLFPAHPVPDAFGQRVTPTD